MTARGKASRKFNYNLQSVLKVRKIKERKEQEEFAAAKRKLEEEQRKEKEIKEFKSTKQDELRAKFEKGKISDFSQILMRQSHLTKVDTDVKHQEKQTRQAEQKNDTQREKLIDSMKSRKIIEKDKENKKKDWKRAVEREETKQIDDIVSARYKRPDHLDTTSKDHS